MSYTIRAALYDGQQRLESASPSAQLDARVLLGEVMQMSHAQLIAHDRDVLTPTQQRHYDEMLKRREAGEPVAYIIGRRAFYDRDIIVTPDVLIPRPETEHVLEAALEFASGKADVMAVDVGTGSGALAVTFKARMPNATVYATDISEAALHVARQNANVHRADIHFLHGDLLKPLIAQQIRVDLIMANLPYIESGELPQLDVSHYEPHLALDGGDDGLDLIRRLLRQAGDVCNPAATILLEIGATQGQATLELARNTLSPAQVDIIKDLAGHDRVVRIIL
ncbi:MAG: peptide chain release factor N(5)-glutamine methyltransferase [Chloroflexi bacterium]|nr:MAG: peptide chain release factor N(5)-glutamine methyltransferase [Chloroflexota bacterium]